MFIDWAVSIDWAVLMAVFIDWAVFSSALQRLRNLKSQRWKNLTTHRV